MRRARHLPAVGLLLAALILGAAARADVVGKAVVVDGDTIIVRDTRIRLFGIDAPEHRQLCRKAGRDYGCGAEAAVALGAKLGAARIRCVERGQDRYRRVLAVCHLGAEDINGWMVRQGWAVAFVRYAKDYVALEEEAREARRGLWRGDFETPAEWRKRHPR